MELNEIETGAEPSAPAPVSEGAKPLYSDSDVDGISPSLTDLGIPSIDLELVNGKRFRAYAKNRFGKVRVSGKLHKEFSALTRERQRRFDAARQSFKHLSTAMQLESSEGRERLTAYMAEHVQEVFDEMQALSASVENPGLRLTPQHSEIEFAFTYDAIGKLLTIEEGACKGDYLEYLSAISSPPESDFWLEQNYPDLRDFVSWFREHLGL